MAYQYETVKLDKGMYSEAGRSFTKVLEQCDPSEQYKGTPLEHLPRLTEQDILRTVALFRYINPTANIRLGAGRALLTNDGETAFQSGASATITGNMLTTVACATIRSDREMLQNLGRDVTPEYWDETH